MMLILGRVARVLNRPVVLMSGHLSGEQADVSLLRRTTSGSVRLLQHGAPPEPFLTNNFLTPPPSPMPPHLPAADCPPHCSHLHAPPYNIPELGCVRLGIRISSPPRADVIQCRVTPPTAPPHVLRRELVLYRRTIHEYHCACFVVFARVIVPQRFA